jgi:hypothetical protein
MADDFRKTSMSVFAMFAALSATALASANQPTFPGPCGLAYRTLTARSDVPQSSIDLMACISMQPGGQSEIHTFARDGYKGVKDYLRCTAKFAHHVSERVHAAGATIVILDDDATLPLAVLRKLMRIRVPLLSHALHGAEKIGHVIFMPDFHFIDSDGFAVIRDHLTRHPVPFGDKLPVVFWRGSTTGGPRREFCGDAQPCSDCLSLPRVQIALRSLNVSWLDADITNAVQSCESSQAQSTLTTMGLLSHHIPSEQWHQHRGVLDVDGNTNAWGHLWRMLTGSVVFKVDSDYFSAYNHAQRAWVHYVPILRDLSNLEIVTALVASDKAEIVNRLDNVADNAMQMGLQFTYKNEVVRVAGELDAVWGQAGGQGIGL